MSNKTKKAAFILMCIVLISKTTGFFRDIVLAQSFGAGNITDAYLTAINIPVVLFDGISAALGTTFIPMFFKVREDKGEEEVNKFTSNILNIVILLSILLIVIGLAFTPYIVKIFAIGFDSSQLQLTTQYARILLFSMVFIASNGLISSYLIARGNVYISGLVTIPFNVFVIIAIVLGKFTNSYVMVFGTMLAYVAQLLFQLPFLHRKGYKHSFKVNFKDDNIKSIILLVIPVFLGSYVNQINTVVNRTLASTLEVGSITALNYANKLNIFAIGIVVTSLTTVMYPILSKLASENNIKGFKNNIRKSINIILVIMVPIMVIIMDLSTPIVKMLFEEGSFDAQDTYLTSTALFYYAVGMVAYGLRDILAKAFYSLQDTKTPVRNATFSVVINIILSIVLVKAMGIGGLALASSIASIVTACLLFVSLRRKIGKLGFMNIAVTFIKVITASAIMGVSIKLLYNYIFRNAYFLVVSTRKFIGIDSLISVLIGVLIYICLVVIFNVKEAKEIIEAAFIQIKKLVKKLKF